MGVRSVGSTRKTQNLTPLLPMQQNKGDPSSTDPPPEEPLRGQLQALRSEVQTVREKVEQLSKGVGSDQLLTRQEAAERLRVSTRTLDDLEASGRITAIRIGRRVLYHPDTLESFVRAQARGGDQS